MSRSEADWERLRRTASMRRRRGQSIAAIARDLGVSPSTLRQRFIDWDVKPFYQHVRTTCRIFWCDRTDIVGDGLCSRCYMRQKLGTDPNLPPRPTQADRERLRPEATARREGGENIASIAADLGVSKSTLGNWLSQWGVQPPDDPTPWPHGRPGAFISRGCRCEVCLPAFKEYKRAERAKRRTKPVLAAHGTTKAYSQGCRCDECAEAMRVYLRDRNDSTRGTATRHRQQWTGADAELAYTRTDLTIAQRAEMLGRTYAAVDDFIRAYDRRPDDPYGIKRT